MITGKRRVLDVLRNLARLSLLDAVAVGPT